MTIGERIKQRRIELDMSQDELAKKVGYKSRSSIQKIEAARNLPTTKIEIMANALDTTPSYLMGWDGAIKELQRQVKPITSFFNAHTIDYNHIFEEMINKYGIKDIERTLNFAQAFMSASPERQKIALEILQSRQEDS